MPYIVFVQLCGTVDLPKAPLSSTGLLAPGPMDRDMFDSADPGELRRALAGSSASTKEALEPLSSTFHSVALLSIPPLVRESFHDTFGTILGVR